MISRALLMELKTVSVVDRKPLVYPTNCARTVAVDMFAEAAQT